MAIPTKYSILINIPAEYCDEFLELLDLDQVVFNKHDLSIKQRKAIDFIKSILHNMNYRPSLDTEDFRQHNAWNKYLGA